MPPLDTDTINALLVQIAEVPNPIEESKALNDLVEICAKQGIGKTAVRKQYASIKGNLKLIATEAKKQAGAPHLKLVGQPVTPAVVPFTDPLEIEALNIFAQQCSADFRYNADAGVWMEWTGSRWREDRLLRADRRVIEVVEGMRQLDPQNRQALGKLAFSANTLKGARSHPHFIVRQADFDADPLLIGTPSGYVDLKTGETHKPDPSKMISRVCGVQPADSVNAPVWTEFMKFATGGDEAVLRYMQKFFGYSLSGLVVEEIMTFIFGPGGNGKGVMLSAIGRIMGDYYKAAPSSTFMDSKHQEHSTELARLDGPRLVSASETNEDDKWNLSRIKEITGNENPIVARFMRENFFEFWPKFKLLIVGNSKPSFGDVDPAITRRLRMIEMTAVPIKPDTTLKDRLREEYSSILRWMIDGFEAYQDEGLEPPDAVRKASAAYLASEDMVKDFIAKWLIITPSKPDLLVYRSEIREACAAYTQLNGTQRRLTAARVYKRLVEAHSLDGEATHKMMRCFKGVTFQQDAQEALTKWRNRIVLKEAHKDAESVD